MITCSYFDVLIQRVGSDEPIHHHRGDERPFTLANDDLQVNAELMGRGLPPIEGWTPDPDSPGVYMLSQQEDGDGMEAPDGDFIAVYTIKLVCHGGEFWPHGHRPWHRNPALLTELSEQLANPDYYRTVYGCIEVTVHGSDGEKIASCAPDYFLDMYSNGFHQDGNAVDWSDVRSLTVRTI